MNLKKGYSQNVIRDNVLQLIEDNIEEKMAIAFAISTARANFKRDNPQSTNFPKHLIPGQSLKAYQEYQGGEQVGE